jgi:hypothetical protein
MANRSVADIGWLLFANPYSCERLLLAYSVEKLPQKAGLYEIISH